VTATATATATAAATETETLPSKALKGLIRPYKVIWSHKDSSIQKQPKHESD